MARDGRQILWNVVIPLCKTGIAIGSIFVVSLVMGDFVTVRLMSGGQSASVGLMIANADVAAAISGGGGQCRGAAGGGAGPDRRHPARRRYPPGTDSRCCAGAKAVDG